MVDLLPNCKSIGNKWVLRIKPKTEDIIGRYNACLVDKSYTEQVGINYEEKLFPVIRFFIIRLILAVTAYVNLKLHQIDVNTAFFSMEI